jgi:asparagine synthase (glutamine-hydrolysing)
MRGIVRPGYIEELQRLRRTGHAVYYGALTWSLLMLEEWLLAHPA